MAQLRQDYQAIKAAGAEVIAICPEDEAAVKRYWEAERLPFLGIPDPKHEIARMYGQRVRILKLGRLPSLLVVGRDGVVKVTHHGESMSDIPTTEVLLGKLRELPAGTGSATKPNA